MLAKLLGSLRGHYGGLWLTGDAGGDDDDVGAGEGVLETVIFGEKAVDLGDGGDVGEVGGHAGGVDDIVEGEVVDVRAGLEKEGERLRAVSGHMKLASTVC